MPPTVSVKKIKAYTLADLLRALANLIPSAEERPAVIPRQEFHVQDKMREVLELLASKSTKGEALLFTEVIHKEHNRSETIASFLAILELLRLKQIRILQEKAFAPLYIIAREEQNNGTV